MNPVLLEKFADAVWNSMPYDERISAPSCDTAREVRNALVAAMKRTGISLIESPEAAHAASADSGGAGASRAREG